MKKKLLFFAVCLSIFFISGQAQNAWRQLPCERANQSEIVFVGQAVKTKIDQTAEEREQFSAEFIVREAFVGSTIGEKVVAVSPLMVADHSEIKVGGTYLVYAGRRSEGSGVRLGWGTRSLSEAVEDLLHLRDAYANGVGSRIFGKADFLAKSSLFGDFREPMGSIALRVTSRETNKSVETITDEYGNFNVDGLSAGLYTVSLKSTLPARLIAYEPSIALGKFGCYQVDVEVRFTTQVKGAIVDREGLPVAKAALELVPVGYQKPRYNVWGPNESTRSDDSGNFTISNVPPGKYHLAVNYNVLPEKESPYPTSYFPGTHDRRKAQVIEVTEEKDVDALRFVLGPEKLSEKRVSGRVMYSDGRPVARAEIYLKEDENEICCVLTKAVTDGEGKFQLIGFASRKYRIWTFVDHKPFTNKINYLGTSPAFELGDSTLPFTIVMRPTLKSSLDAIDEIEKGERRKIR